MSVLKELSIKLHRVDATDAALEDDEAVAQSVSGKFNIQHCYWHMVIL